MIQSQCTQRHDLDISITQISTITPILSKYAYLYYTYKQVSGNAPNFTRMIKYHLTIFLLIISQATCLSQIDNNGNLITYFSDPPSFNNGSVYQFAIWVYSNITYPKTALQDEISGRVIARIFIDSNGKVDSVKIVQGLRSDIDQEVKRVIESSPTWTPAKANDLPIGMFFSFPVDFTLDDQQFEKKINKFSRIEKRNRKKHYR